MYQFVYRQAGFEAEVIGTFISWNQFERLIVKERETILGDDPEGLDTVEVLNGWYSRLLTLSIDELNGQSVNRKWESAVGTWSIEMEA